MRKYVTFYAEVVADRAFRLVT